MALVLAVATIVAVFPPIDAQATSDDNYYIFFTGFDGSSLEIGYFAQTNTLGSGDVYGCIDYYEYEYWDLTSSDYDDFVSIFSAIYPFRTLASVNSSNSNPSYLSLDEDANFHIYDLYDYDYLVVSVNGNTVFDDYADWGHFLIPEGNYQINYSLEQFSGSYYYFMDINDFAGFGPEANGFVAKMYQQIKDKANEIGLAAQGLNADGSVNATKTVYYTAPSVNAEIIKALMNAEGVTLVVTYTYEGFEFTSTITPEKARAMYREDITWYGPAYIAKFCSATWTGKTV